MPAVPSEWTYLDRKFPGSYYLWLRDVDVSTSGWLLGITGSGVAVVVSPEYATDVTCDLYFHLCALGWVKQHVKQCKRTHPVEVAASVSAAVVPPSRAKTKSRFRSRVSGDSFFWRGKWRRC